MRSSAAGVARAEAERGEVVRQRIEPHVHHVLRIAGHGNAPGERRAADAQILKPSLDERPHFVQPELRLDEIRDDRDTSRAASADTSTAGSSSSLPSAARPSIRRSDTCRPRVAPQGRTTRRRCNTSPRTRLCRYRRPSERESRSPERRVVARLGRPDEVVVRDRQVRHICRKAIETSSANVGVSRPAFCAARATFCPCSSVPVRKNTSSPISRRDRAIASASIVVYAWPIWGWALM